jgi:AcrR family transcriptional regulator
VINKVIIRRKAVKSRADTGQRLAQELGVEAMSLYHHVADKNEVLDGMVDVALGEINARVAEIGMPPGSCRPAGASRCHAATWLIWRSERFDGQPAAWCATRRDRRRGG